MIRFLEFEVLGPGVAAMSNKADGDCRLPQAGATEAAWAGRLQFFAACGIPREAVVGAQQVHGKNVAHIEIASPDREPLTQETAIPAADALITNLPEVALSISVADCVPIYLFDTKKKCAGLAHAGRKGTLLGIGPATVSAMAKAFRAEPVDIHALIGPSAGPCHYEVSPPMAEEWRKTGLPANNRHLDLWAANALQLESIGIPRKHIRISQICTICNEAYFSYRGGDKMARNLALLRL